MKFAPFVVITLVVGAAVGWLAPGASETSVETAPPNELEATETPAEMEAMQRDHWLAGEMVLSRDEDGHFYADVTVDGATARMLVDTGATTVALTAEDAQAMGIFWDERDIGPVARGASGMVYGVHVTLDHVELGDLEARNVSAVVVPEGLGISLLGQSFLSQIERVEMESDRMVLGG